MALVPFLRNPEQFIAGPSYSHGLASIATVLPEFRLYIEILEIRVHDEALQNFKPELQHARSKKHEAQTVAGLATFQRCSSWSSTSQSLQVGVLTLVGQHCSRSSSGSQH